MIFDNSLRFPIVLFDLGSTLYSFNGDWRSTLLESQEKLVLSLLEAGYPVDPLVFPRLFGERLDAYRSERENEYIELTTLYVLRNLMAETGFTNVPVDLLRDCLKAMYSVTQACWELESDAQATLEQLQKCGRRLGVVSNAADDADVQALIDKAGIRPFFDVIISSAAVGRRKPHPAIFRQALETWQAEPQQAVMVGDLLGADILGARNLGMTSIWITRRADRIANHPFINSVKPDAAIEALMELPSLLENWDNKDNPAGA